MKQGVQCCFCEQTILVAGPDPCFLNLRTSDPEEKGAFQEMFVMPNASWTMFGAFRLCLITASFKTARYQISRQ